MIRGEKWNDLNANGVKDGRAGAAGLDDLSGYQYQWSFDFGEPSTTTDADGNYVFSAVQPGTYIVGEVNQTGWQQTSPGEVSSERLIVHFAR